MTLDTRIFILDEVDPHEVFNFCNDLLGAKNPRFKEGPSDWDADKEVIHLDNEPGQGYPAWLMSKYRAEGKPLYEKDITLRDTDPDYYDDPAVESDGSRVYKPACFMEISFDTAYGYQDEYGGCSTLHARYIVDLHAFLLAKGVRIKWKDEFSGDIHDGIHGIEEFLGGGDKAMTWFKEVLTVLPEILNKTPKE